MSAAKPPLKWAGGKGQLVPELLAIAPKSFGGYHENFLGGGAFFLSLLPRAATLIDNNAELIDLYTTIRDDVHPLIEELEGGEYVYESERYYGVRAWDREPGWPKNTGRVRRAARTIYLNRCGYNGLYRVNRSGQFNAPFGRYTNPTICNGPNLLAVSEALRDARLVRDDFSACGRWAREGDLIYMDPPYVPSSQTANFVSYTCDGFDMEDQGRLASFFREMDSRGCLLMLSNSHHPDVLELYGEFEIRVVMARRNINRDGGGRGKVREIVVTNYRAAKP